MPMSVLIESWRLVFRIFSLCFCAVGHPSKFCKWLEYLQGDMFKYMRNTDTYRPQLMSNCSAKLWIHLDGITVESAFPLNPTSPLRWLPHETNKNEKTYFSSCPCVTMETDFSFFLLYLFGLFRPCLSASVILRCYSNALQPSAN